jgi:CheY-like chemotaxis protein
MNRPAIWPFTFRIRWFFTLMGSISKDSQTAPTGGNGEKETVLVVDDEPIILDLAEQFLQRHGYRVITATNGDEALRIYREHAIDLVILDIGLPGMDGLNCLKALIAVNRRVKVVISSGYSSDGDAEEALKLGAVSFLPKPYTVYELLRMTKRVLDGTPR